MVRVHLLVEGQTEEIVVREVLEPYLRDNGVFVSSSILVTKRPASGAMSRGGVSKWFKLKGEILRLLKDTSLDALTTIVDYYGLPADTPGMGTRPAGDPYLRVNHVETSMRDDIGDKRFLPHAVLHELESWVLCGSEILGAICEDQRAGQRLRRLVDDAGGPELVNGNPDTAPSKHIQRHIPRFRKTFDGPWTISEVGVPSIRAACPHADRWIEDLLSFST